MNEYICQEKHVSGSNEQSVQREEMANSQFQFKTNIDLLMSIQHSLIKAAEKHVTLPNRRNQQCITHCATLTVTGRQARARPISSTPRKKKLEREARNGRVAGRQLFINETYKRAAEHRKTLRLTLTRVKKK